MIYTKRQFQEGVTFYTDGFIGLSNIPLWTFSLPYQKPPAFFLLSYIVNMPKKSKTGRFFAKKIDENKNSSTSKCREIRKSQAIFLFICMSGRFHLGN